MNIFFKKHFLYWCFIGSILTGGMSVNAGTPEVSAPTENKKLSRFNSLIEWIKTNKMCLTGTGCPLWMSYGAHFMLGVAVGLGIQLTRQEVSEAHETFFIKITGRPSRSLGHLFSEQITPDLWQDVANLFVGQYVHARLSYLMNWVVELGYENIVTAAFIKNIFPSHGVFGLPYLSFQCLFRGTGCDVTQRRRAFFEAGMLIPDFQRILRETIRPFLGE